MGGDARLDLVREQLRATFVALPKRADGKVGDAALRHSLHRLFLKQHGWNVNGMEPRGGLSESPLASRILVDRAPGSVKDVFEKYAKNGAGLEEMSMLAVTIEHLIQTDQLQILNDIFRAKQLPSDAQVTKAQMQDLIELYMASFLRGRNVSTWTPELVHRFQGNMAHLYPAWRQTKKLLQEISNQVTDPSLTQYSHSDVAKVILEIGSKFMHLNEDQCHVVKKGLVDKDGNNLGRVPLTEFYTAAFHKKRYQFKDTESALRSAHTLDESESGKPKVIIPNYMIGTSNCVAKTNYYSMCCPLECEDVLINLETALGKAKASAEDIASVVKEPPLSDSLVAGLKEIAGQHGGFVPIYGQSFAAWLHQVYPRECISPHWTLMEPDLQAAAVEVQV